MHSYTALLTHITFSTSERRPVITDDIRPRLHRYLEGIARRFDVIPLACNGVDDHVHMLVKTPPALPISELINKLKSNSSKWIHETFPAKTTFQWQRGYGAFSVSRSSADAVVRYIARQEEHHKRADFREEFRALLKRYDVTVDERYLFV